MKQEIKLKVIKGIFGWFSLIMAGGTILYSANVLLLPTTGLGDHDATDVSISNVTMAAFLLIFIYLGRAIVRLESRVVFGESITIHRIMDSPRKVSYSQLKPVRIDAKRCRIYLQFEPPLKSSASLTLKADTHEQTLLRELLSSHGFTAASKEKDDVSVIYLEKIPAL